MIVRIIIIALAVAFFVSPAISNAGDTRVRGYWRDSDRDGIKDQYVEPYHRSSPDRTPTNNYGYPGNYNPNSGSFSTGNPDSYNSRERNDRRNW